jgi:hypothetical protein
MASATIPVNSILFVDTDKISDSDVLGPDSESVSENEVIKKLAAAIKAVGSRYEASLVLASSEATWIAATAIICVNEDFDITQEVIEELKKDYKSIE